MVKKLQILLSDGMPHRFVVEGDVPWYLWLGDNQIENDNAVIGQLLKPPLHTVFDKGDHLKELGVVDLVDVMFATECPHILSDPVKYKGLSEFPAVGADQSNQLVSMYIGEHLDALKGDCDTVIGHSRRWCKGISDGSDGNFLDGCDKWSCPMDSWWVDFIAEGALLDEIEAYIMRMKRTDTFLISFYFGFGG